MAKSRRFCRGLQRILRVKKWRRSENFDKVGILRICGVTARSHIRLPTSTFTRYKAGGGPSALTDKRWGNKPQTELNIPSQEGTFPSEINTTNNSIALQNGRHLKKRCKKELSHHILVFTPCIATPPDSPLKRVPQPRILLSLPIVLNNHISHFYCSKWL